MELVSSNQLISCDFPRLGDRIQVDARASRIRAGSQSDIDLSLCVVGHNTKTDPPLIGSLCA
jgi:hypothetical protein